MLIWPCYRTLVLADAAKELEHGIYILCATPSGYAVRMLQKRRALASLVTDMGKVRAKAIENGGFQDEDVDVEEVMKALRGGVQWWHKMQKGVIDT